MKHIIKKILKEERNISDIIKIVAKEYNCSTWEINNGYCEDFALNVLEKLGGYEDNLFELSGDMFFNQRDPEFAKENWGDVIETNYGVWSKNLLDYWGYPPNVNLNLVDDEINHVWLFYNGKHYDAEVPEGVDNWFEIPLIKRLFNRYKKNMVQENIKRILKEESLKQTLMDEIMRSGIRDTANMISVDVKELLEMVGITGTKEDRIFLIESIMKNEAKEEFNYCSYDIVPTPNSITLYVFIPKPLPEHEGVWSFDQWVVHNASMLLKVLIHKLGGGLIRGHYIYVYNTGDC